MPILIGEKLITFLMLRYRVMSKIVITLMIQRIKGIISSLRIIALRHLRLISLLRSPILVQLKMRIRSIRQLILLRLGRLCSMGRISRGIRIMRLLGLLMSFWRIRLRSIWRRMKVCFLCRRRRKGLSSGCCRLKRICWRVLSLLVRRRPMGTIFLIITYNRIN